MAMVPNMRLGAGPQQSVPGKPGEPGEGDLFARLLAVLPDAPGGALAGATLPPATVQPAPADQEEQPPEAMPLAIAGFDVPVLRTEAAPAPPVATPAGAPLPDPAVPVAAAPVPVRPDMPAAPEARAPAPVAPPPGTAAPSPTVELPNTVPGATAPAPQAAAPEAKPGSAPGPAAGPVPSPVALLAEGLGDKFVPDAANPAAPPKAAPPTAPAEAGARAAIVAPIQIPIPPEARPQPKAVRNAAAPTEAPAPAPAAAQGTAPLQPPPFAIDAPTTPAPVAGAAPSGPLLAAAPDLAIEQQLDLAHEGEWLDRLARDIARTAGGEGAMRFRLNPETLGALKVEVAQGDQGAHVRITAETETARAILAEAQPKLLAEARAQGVRIADAQVDLGGQTAGDSRRQETERPAPMLRTGRPAADAEPAAEQSRNRTDRYA